MKAKHLLIVFLSAASLAACDKTAFLPEAEHKVQADDRSKAPDDLCATTFCPPNSSCINGQCLCDQGWEGLACSKGYSDKFVGAYQQIDSCELGTFWIFQPVEVIKIDNQNVKISNFGGFGGGPDLDMLLGKIEKAIPGATSAQKLSVDGYDQIGLHFEVTGILKDSIILGDYKVTYPDGYYETCHFRLTKM